jgi:hypothetical protein
MMRTHWEREKKAKNPPPPPPHHSWFSSPWCTAPTWFMHWVLILGSPCSLDHNLHIKNWQKICHVLGGHPIHWNFSLAKGQGEIGHLAFFFKFPWSALPYTNARYH